MICEYKQHLHFPVSSGSEQKCHGSAEEQYICTSGVSRFFVSFHFFDMKNDFLSLTKNEFVRSNLYNEWFHFQFSHFQCILARRNLRISAWMTCLILDVPYAALQQNTSIRSSDHNTGNDVVFSTVDVFEIILHHKLYFPFSRRRHF
jgi:hypothetical protein